MKKALHIRETRFAIWYCVPYILICFFFYHINRLISDSKVYVFSWCVLTYVELGGYLILFFIIRLVYRTFTQLGHFDLKLLYPASMYFIAIAFAIHFPYKWSSEIFESKPLFKAHRDGTVSFIDLTLRSNHTYEINNSAMGFPSYSYGTWKQEKDTIYFSQSKTKGSPFLKDTMVIDEGFLRDYYEIKDSHQIYQMSRLKLLEF